jgi:hypothetical protein
MKRKKRRSPSAPGLGRNLALRPGGASDQLRREIEDQRGELEEPETSRPRSDRGSAAEGERPPKKHGS